MQWLELLKAALLGIVQGITEWLPISSTGHMILVNEFLPMDFSKEFIDMFLVVIQFGSILAVVLLYWDKLWPVNRRQGRLEINGNTMSLWGKVLVAVLPAAVIGLLFDDLITQLLYGPVTVATTLIIYGALFIALENQRKRPKITSLASLDLKTCAMIGVFQVLALIPGTSRSGATILGAVFLGCSRFVSAEFSFFLAVPVMFGASGLKIVKYVKHLAQTQTALSGFEISVLLTGMAVAFVVSIFAIRFLMGYIKKHDFKAFGWYRIALGVLVLVWFGLLAK